MKIPQVERFSRCALVAFALLFCAVSLPPARAAATVTVNVGMNGLMFSPSSVSINAGDTVQWVWKSSGHSVTSGTPNAPTGQFNSGIQSAPFTFSQTFNNAGTVQYYCQPHGSCCQMVGTVHVAAATPTPTPTPTPTATPTPTPTPTASPTPPLPDVAGGLLRVEVKAVASGLTAPTDLVTANDNSNRLFIVGQHGIVSILKNGQLLATPFLDVTARIVALNPSYDERGLLGLAFHPDFAKAGKPGFHKLYTYTSEPIAGPADFTVPNASAFDHQSVVAEWQVDANNPDVVNPASRREVMRIDEPEFNHNGGKLAFRPSDQDLYIALGDGGAANDVGAGHNPVTGNGQDITTVLGKLLRIDPLNPALTTSARGAVSANGKYRVPSSNPFVGGPGLDEIYAYGFRNPFRFSFDPPSDKLIVGDVGQNNVEEIDVVQAGKNYGWNKKEGTFLFNPADGTVSPDPAPDPAFVDPIAEYSHQDGTAVLGGFVYRGSALPALVGKYVFAELSNGFSKPAGRLFFLDRLAPGPVREFQIGNDPRQLGYFVKGVGEDAGGEIYILADKNIGPSGTAGKVLKIVPPAASPALLNLSTRMDVGSDQNVMIGGFIIIGSTPKQVLLRGIGPSLTKDNQPFPGRLADPLLELHDSSGAVIDSNDDWVNSPQKQQIMDTRLQPLNDHESALLESLQPGAYTAILRSATSATGIGLVELYDLAQSAPANAVNLSTRGFVQTGDSVMIGGFSIGGGSSRTLLVRAIGPSLAGPSIPNALPDPNLELHDASGAKIAENNDWRSTQEQQIENTGAAPQNDKESALLMSLTPGQYTAIVSGVGGSTGVAAVEVYQIH